jgi:hypothetical protein
MIFSRSSFSRLKMSVAAISEQHEPFRDNNSNVISVENPGAGSTGNLSAYGVTQEQYYLLNVDYHKRRYRKKYENPDRFRDLVSEQKTVIEHLKTAVEGKMEIAVIGVLSDILVSLDPNAGDSNNLNTSSTSKGIDIGDRQRALYKAGACTIVDSALRTMGGE